MTKPSVAIWHLFVDCLFIIDYALVFFRAYRDEKGVIIFSRKAIAIRYFTSGWFFINLFACFPAAAIMYRKYHRTYSMTGIHDEATRFVYFLNIFKMFRLIGMKGRIIQLVDSSDFSSWLWTKFSIEKLKMIEFTFYIILLTHWFGCMWGFIAFVEVGSWEEEDMLSTPNWMGNWQNITGVDYGLNTLGWDNDLGRYWLCMFWASQTITSIGYGNIIPVTTAEFALANFLMLCSGIFWSYVIGNLVEIVSNASKLSRDITARTDNASQMVWDFTTQTLPGSVTGSNLDQAQASSRVRRFISNERAFCTKNGLDDKNALTLSEAYPTLDILSPELRRVCALHLTHTYLETIPYLSSKYLSPNEQAEIALQCRTLEFSMGEHFSSHPEFGRGIIIFKHGLGFTSRNLPRTNFTWTRDLAGHAADVNEVLVEDEYCKEKHLIYHFVNYTKVLFVPRDAIMQVLEKNPVAWKDCARWRYFGAALVLYSLKVAESRSEESV